MKTLLLFLLIPVFSFAQKATLLLDASYLYSKNLKSGYGFKATAGTSIYKSTYLGAGVEVIKFDRASSVMIPVTASLFTAPKKSDKNFGFMGIYSVGWDIKQNGYFFSSIFAGIKGTNSKACPYVLVGLAKPHFQYGVNKNVLEYVAFSLKAGVAL